MRVSHLGAIALSAILVWTRSARACDSDVACKGDRVCVAGQCVDPASTAPPSAPPPPKAPTSVAPAPLPDLAGTNAAPPAAPLPLAAAPAIPRSTERVYERRSGLLITGIVLSGVGAISTGFSTAALVAVKHSYDREKAEKDACIDLQVNGSDVSCGDVPEEGVLVAGVFEAVSVAMFASGVTFLIAGLPTYPLDDTASAVPSIQVGPGAVRAEWKF